MLATIDKIEYEDRDDKQKVLYSRSNCSFEELFR